MAVVFWLIGAEEQIEREREYVWVWLYDYRIVDEREGYGELKVILLLVPSPLLPTAISLPYCKSANQPNPNIKYPHLAAFSFITFSICDL